MYGLLHSPVSHLMGALSDALGQTVDFDENDECFLEFEGDIEVVIAQVREMQFLSMRCAITEVARSLDGALLQQSLSLNYTTLPPGYALALDDDSARLVLLALIDADHSAADHFLSMLAGFLELVPALRAQCAPPDEDIPHELPAPGVFA